MRKTKALGWAVSAAAALAIAPPALAGLVPEFSVNDKQTQGSHSISVTGVGRILSTDADSHTIQLDCSATAGEPAAGVGTPDCYLVGADGRRFDAPVIQAVPGVKSVSGGVLDVPRQTYRVCLSGRALFRDNIEMLTQLRCSP